MRSRLVLLTLCALLGLALLAYLAGRAALSGTIGGPQVQTNAQAPREDVPLEAEAASAGGSTDRPPRAAAEGTPAAPDAAEAAPAPDARIDGLVVRPDGKPAAIARVKYTQWRPDRGPEDQPEDSTVTDEQGLFTINPAPVGHLQLVALHDEFADSAVSEFDLAAGEQKRDLRLELREFARIRGLVLDAHNVARAKISVSCEDLESRKALFSESDAAGRFEFTKVSAGMKFVRLKVPREELDVLRADSPSLAIMLSEGDHDQFVAVAPGQTVELVLGGIPADGVRVFGQVSSAEVPLPRTWIWIEDDTRGWNTAARARTDERGAYELWLPARGPFRFHLVGAGGGLDLVRAATITEPREQRLDFDVPGGSLSGRVIDNAGRPVPEANLILNDVGPPEASAGREYEFWSPHMPSDAEGRFAFVHLPAGRYELVAIPASKPDAESAYGRARTGAIELAAGATKAGLEIVLTPGCTIRGVVHGAPEGMGRMLYVSAYDESGRSVAGARPDADGSFVLRGLIEGSYGLCAQGGDLAAPVCEPVRVRRDLEPQVELQVARCSQLRVTPKCPAGEQPSMLDVLILDERKNQVWVSNSSAPDLDFGWFFVAPGTYRVELTGPGGWTGTESVLVGEGGGVQVEVPVRHAK